MCEERKEGLERGSEVKGKDCEWKAVKGKSIRVKGELGRGGRKCENTGIKMNGEKCKN